MNTVTNFTRNGNKLIRGQQSQEKAIKQSAPECDSNKWPKDIFMWSNSNISEILDLKMLFPNYGILIKCLHTGHDLSMKGFMKLPYEYQVTT